MKNTLLIYLVTLGGVMTCGQVMAAEHMKSGMSDEQFATKAAAGGLTEVTLGNLAAQNGGSEAVKDFGAKMVTDHGKANDNLKSVAEKDSITIPDKPTEEQQAMIDKLTKESGDAFDKDYVHAMLKAHMGDKALFTKESTDGKNADLKQFASDTLPVIKEHLKMIEDMSGSGGSGNHAKKGGDTMNHGTSAESKSGTGPGANAAPATTPQ